MITEQIFHPPANTKRASLAIKALSTARVPESLFKINDSVANKISYYHLALFVASLPFNLFYSHLILISYALHTLIHLKKSADEAHLKSNCSYPLSAAGEEGVTQRSAGRVSQPTGINAGVSLKFLAERTHPGLATLADPLFACGEKRVTSVIKSPVLRVILNAISPKKSVFKPIFTLKFLVLVSVFLVTVISTIYSINKPEAFNEWGKQLTILIIPLLFCLNPFDLKKYGPRLLMVFALVCTATVVYLYLDAFVTIKHYHLPLTAIFSVAFTNHNFSQPIDMHATFFSMQLMLALAFLIQVLIGEKKRTMWSLYFTCALILSAGLVQLSSKVVCAILFITLNIIVPWFLLKDRARLKFILFSASLSVLTIIILLNSTAFKARFINEFKFDMARPKTGEIFDGRIARWDAAIDLIAKKPFTGYGAGSEIGLLQESFYNRHLYDSYLNRLNAHSEYLSITLKSGLAGLLVYLATLAAGSVIAFHRKNLLFFTFMLLIAFVSASENILDVDKGIIFYAFFFSFFAFNAKPFKKPDSPINSGLIYQR